MKIEVLSHGLGKLLEVPLLIQTNIYGIETSKGRDDKLYGLRRTWTIMEFLEHPSHNCMHSNGTNQCKHQRCKYDHHIAAKPCF